MNPVPTSPLADDIGTEPTGPVAVVFYIPFYTHSKFKQNAVPELVFSFVFILFVSYFSLYKVYLYAAISIHLVFCVYIHLRICIAYLGVNCDNSQLN